MKSVFAYIRVSTPKQGTVGSSLIEQRSAIEAYAGKSGLDIAEWFEETETAAKRGRPTFMRMLRALERGRAGGVIIHKIDRSARNLRDWADLGDLIDRGVEVHFAHESVDMHSRGGRLSADIQAVVAADFIRNLRQEVKKGFYGRLKQGLYPIRAPIGYLDCGRGKAKTIDPVQGPLVRAVFELYSTGDYNFETLLAEMHGRGLRGRNGNRVSKNGLTTMLNNPFYIGVIHIRKTDETFEGVHPPLICKSLYDRAQAVLRGNRLVGAAYKHDFLFRRLIRCSKCEYHLIGERHKDRYIYYRCHTPSCGTVSLNERKIDGTFLSLFELMRFDEEELRDLGDIVQVLRGTEKDDRQAAISNLKIRIGKCDEHLTRLMDAFLDGTIEKPLFESKKSELIRARLEYREKMDTLDETQSRYERVTKKLELANTAYLQYQSAFPHEKRDMVAKITSNFIAEGNNPVPKLLSPFQELVDWRTSLCSEPSQDNPRKRAEHILEMFVDAVEKEMLVQRPPSPEVPHVDKN